jgi:hypothetical protein
VELGGHIPCILLKFNLRPMPLKSLISTNVQLYHCELLNSRIGGVGSKLKGN